MVSGPCLWQGRFQLAVVCVSVINVAVVAEILTSLTAVPFTSGLSSSNNLTVSSARNLPKLSSSRKKFTPKSASVTISGSRMEK